MKNLHRIHLAIALLFFSVADSYGQIGLDCSGRDLHALYIVCPDTGYFRIDSVDTNPSDPIFLVPNYYTTVGICISNNLDTMTGQEAMYSILLGDTYQYWDDTSWVNTSHSPGSADAVNPGGTSDYIFNLDAIGNSVYRYDGTGNGTLLISNLNTYYHSVYDVATDNQGNFYLFYTDSQRITSYTPNGIPMDTFITTGFTTGVHPGFAILGNRMYAISNVDTGLYEGIKTGNTINFSLIKNLPFRVIDIAACPGAGNPLALFKNPEVPHFAVYPNPASDVCIIRLDNTATIEIRDCLGVLKEKINTRTLKEYPLTIGGWEAGVYFITAISENKKYAYKKLIVQ